MIKLLVNIERFNHELEEMRVKAYESSRYYKENMKEYHDKRILNREFL